MIFDKNTKQFVLVVGLVMAILAVLTTFQLLGYNRISPSLAVLVTVVSVIVAVTFAHFSGKMSVPQKEEGEGIEK